ncbi:molybdopterin-binding/glycosyltransferase family 2 protein [Arenibaculum sp.]|uniref:molybdopterin-binding/glycosyltransferase family 2 protein n=1 Tax=Arenibaculum sp. TaxID=2865862 RepID=UPI002E1595D2|nr:molybdopterin-binding/glycosyltransferase family 2 protein [Arenibaculum sp.]
MRFGPIPLEHAQGAILAHSLRTGALTFRKGRKLAAADVAALAAEGIAEVTAALLDPDDVGEDEAATRLAADLLGPGLRASAAFTGRVNLFAERPGVLVLDRERLDRFNRIDEAITVATLPPFAAVEPRQMVATVKIIPFAVPNGAVERAAALARGGEPALRIAGYRPVRAALVQTRLAGTKESVLDRTVAVTRDRLQALGGTLEAERRCRHDEAALAAEIGSLRGTGVEILLIAGASAITDRQDVLPAAIERAGGRVDHFGMPVDPGNLLLLAHLGEVPVLGLPGCARSPKLNGFDWVLQRLAAGVPVGRDEVMAMGVGGLLAEIPSRPLPRASGGLGLVEAPRAPRIAAIVLAAGQSRRMGTNKLVEEVGGMPMVARVVDAVLASAAAPVVVVTGHQQQAVAAALAGRPVTLVHNPAHGEGLSTSLKAGIVALPDDVDGALVCLGDMPGVAPSALDRLIAAYAPAEGRAICVPTFGGKRGNPVLWDRRFFAEMMEIAGDVGARHLVGAHADQVAEVEIGDDGVLVDVDTPEALAALRAGN